MTPAERRIRGRIGALSLHAQGKTNTSPARARFLSRFETEVDPDGTLPAAERSKRAEHARKLYFTRLALKSAATRRDKKEAALKKGTVTQEKPGREEIEKPVS